MGYVMGTKHWFTVRQKGNLIRPNYQSTSSRRCTVWFNLGACKIFQKLRLPLKILGAGNVTRGKLHTEERRHRTKCSRQGRHSAPGCVIPNLGIYGFVRLFYLLQPDDSVLSGCALRLWTSVSRREERRLVHPQRWKVYFPSWTLNQCRGRRQVPSKRR